MVSHNYPTNDLTLRQRSIYDFIISHQQEYNISPTVREICDHFGLRSPGGVHRILSVLRDKGYIQSDPGKKRSWQAGVKWKPPGIALIGTITAGLPIEAIKNREDELEISPQVFGFDSCFGLRVQGDSMIDVQIKDGDIAIIQPQKKVASGEIGAVIIMENDGYEATLKRIYTTNTRLTLKPENPNYSEQVFKGPHRKYVKIIGKMVGLVRDHM